MNPQFSQLSDAEHGWIAANRGLATSLVAEFSPSDADSPVTLSALDRAYSAWVARGEADPERINNVINAIGIAFGQFLVDGAGFNWVIASDPQGTDLAVLALPGEGDVVVYPANFVAKRWERHETYFLERAYAQIAAQVRSVSEHLPR